MATPKVINGLVLRADGTPRASVLIRAKLSQGVTIAGTSEVVPLEVTTKTAPDGSYSLSLYSNSDLTPTGTYYTVTEDAQSGDSYQFIIVVPSSAGPFAISNIQAAAPAPSPPAALDSAVVHLANPETITGTKTFSAAPVVPVASFPETAVASLVADLAAKAVDTAVVHNTGAEPVAGVKTFSSAPVVPAASFPESAVASLTTDLAARALDSAVVHLAGTETMTGDKVHSGRLTTAKDFVHSTRVATETELVAGLDATLAETVVVTLTANRVMGVPSGGIDGHRMKVVLIEGGAGGFTLNTSALSVTNWALNLIAGKSTELPLERIAGTWTLALNPPSTGGTPISKGGMVWNVLESGAIADGVLINDASITSGTNVLHSPSHAFSAADVGKSISVHNAAADQASGSQSLDTTITGLSGSDALLAANAVQTVRGPRTVTDAAMTAGDARITSATAAFSTEDYGKPITIVGAGVAGADLVAVMQANNTVHTTTATEFMVDKPASTTVVGASATIGGGLAGWGTDNRTVGQATIDAASAGGGGTVLWPFVGTGIYYMTHDPNFWPFVGFSQQVPCLRIKSNVELLGVPGVVLAYGTPRQDIGGSCCVFNGDGSANHWRVRGLIFDGLYQGKEGFSSPIHFSGSTDVRVEDCEIRNFAYTGVFGMGFGNGSGAVPYASEIVVRNNYFHHGAGGHVVHLYFATDWIAVNNRSQFATCAGGEIIPLNKCARVVIANNKLEGGTTIACDTNNSDVVISGNAIIANTLSAGQAVRVGTGGGRIVITGNEFDQVFNANGGLIAGAIGPGLAATPGVGLNVTDVTFVGNLVRHPTPMLAGSQGISLNLSTGGTASNWVISANRFVGSLLNISLGSLGVSNFVISDNHFDGGYGDAASSLHVLVNASTVSGNVFLDLLGRGHSIAGNDSEYTGNYWSSAKDAVIRVTGQRNRILGGRIHHTAAEGSGTYWINEATPAGANVYEHIRLTAVSSTVRVVQLFAGGNSVIRDCPGFNPYGPAGNATPAFPATTVLAFNTTGMDGTAWVTAGTAAITAISKGAFPVPVNLAFTDAATGGTLLAATQYGYRVSAVVRRGLTSGSFGPSETLASTETTITTGGGGNTHAVTVKWLPVPGANYYNVYGRTAAGELFMAKVGGHLSSWVDDGSITPAGALPGSNATARAVTAATIAASTTMPIPLRANEGIAFTFASGAPSWILDLN